jgi:hypothetical protein
MRTLLPLLPLALLALLAPGSAAAVGCIPTNCGTATVAVPGSPVLHVRAAGSQGPIAAYDLASGRRSFRLGYGLLSANGRVHVAVGPAGGATTIVRSDARTGRALPPVRLDGEWAPAALSANGRWLALRRIDAKLVRTHLQVIDSRTGSVARALTLNGVIQPEAVANEGDRLFVVQFLRRGYVVRGLELASGRLTTLAAKGDPALMGGTAWSAVASPDGRWLLTLYFEPDGGAAVHTLDLVHGRAYCIDIPSGKPAELRNYAIALSPDGRHAFAVNPSLGAIADVDLRRLRVARVGSFARRDLPGAEPGAAAVATGTGGVYFGSGPDLWRYADGRTQLVSEGRARIVGLGLRPGNRVLVVRAS